MCLTIPNGQQGKELKGGVYPDIATPAFDKLLRFVVGYRFDIFSQEIGTLLLYKD